LQSAGATLEVLPARDPALAMSRLLAYDVCDILVEGGAVLHRSIWNAGVVDRVRLYVAPVTLGAGAVPWMLGGEISMAALGGGEPQSLGDDVLLEADV